MSGVKRTSRVQCEVSAYRCSTAKERRLRRLEHDQFSKPFQRLDEHPEKMRERRR
jgi:hypothetical protein